jgi:hypothetical protein
VNVFPDIYGWTFSLDAWVKAGDFDGSHYIVYNPGCWEEITEH